MIKNLNFKAIFKFLKLLVIKVPDFSWMPLLPIKPGLNTIFKAKYVFYRALKHLLYVLVIACNRK